jgi:hypothetical protein
MHPGFLHLETRMHRWMRRVVGAGPKSGDSAGTPLAQVLYWKCEPRPSIVHFSIASLSKRQSLPTVAICRRADKKNLALQLGARTYLDAGSTLRDSLDSTGFARLPDGEREIRTPRDSSGFSARNSARFPCSGCPAPELLTSIRIWPFSKANQSYPAAARAGDQRSGITNQGVADGLQTARQGPTQHWRRLDGAYLLPLVRARVKFVDGFGNKTGMLFDQLITRGVRPARTAGDLRWRRAADTLDRDSAEKRPARRS